MTDLGTHVVLGTGPWGRLRSRDRHKLMGQAWALGLREIDTAPSYGFGGVEHDVFKVWPGFVSTKVGLQPRRWQRIAAPLYPLLHEASIMARGASDRNGPGAVAPQSALDEDAVRSGAARLASPRSFDLRTVWIHDPPTVEVGLEAHRRVSGELGLSPDECGIAWTSLPSSLPSEIPLLLPFSGACSELDDRRIQWHGVVRFYRDRSLAEQSSGSSLDEYLAGTLRSLPENHRLVIGAYRPQHLDTLHRVASLCREADQQQALAEQLAHAVHSVERHR